MLKYHLAACMMATALVATPALAQSYQKAGDAPAAAPSQSMGQTGQIKYITQNSPNLWRASKLDGVGVYNEQNEKIGDITEVLLDRQGKVEAVVIGVGGFLGLGQRDVAVPFDALEWQMSDRDSVAGMTTRSTTTTTTTTGAASTDAGAVRPADRAAAPADQMAAAPADRSAAPADRMAAPADRAAPAAPADRMAAPADRTAATTTTTRAAGDLDRDAPARAILRGATKEQLKNAPEFKYAS
jgi:hypothetical protein